MLHKVILTDDKKKPGPAEVIVTVLGLLFGYAMAIVGIIVVVVLCSLAAFGLLAVALLTLFSSYDGMKSRKLYDERVGE